MPPVSSGQGSSERHLGHTRVFLKQMEQEIRESIPRALDLSHDYRKWRGRETWIGAGLSSMFGLVNEDQMKKMKDSVQSMLEVSRSSMQEMRTFSIMRKHI